ncbi:MAG: hypothetical protein PF489_04870 [Salinivirgaceae bacterium]|jgi:hypothetical protein|nr:hypothetical protein [Salinivirgaceae bacterium]
MYFLTNYPYITVSVIAFTINIPLGYFRAKTRKYSAAWFLWIHASIPFIVWFRITNDLDNWIIIVNVLLAISGQLAGSFIHQKRLQKR